MMMMMMQGHGVGSEAVSGLGSESKLGVGSEVPTVWKTHAFFFPNILFAKNIMIYNCIYLYIYCMYIHPISILNGWLNPNFSEANGRNAPGTCVLRRLEHGRLGAAASLSR